MAVISQLLTIIALSIFTFSQACYEGCRFQLCSQATVSLSPPNDTAVTPPLCLPGANVGISHSGEALVQTSVGFRNISAAKLPGLKQPFAPSFFKLFPIINTTTSGVGHEVPQTNQKMFLKNTCVILPVTDYQSFVKGDVDNVVLDYKPFSNCVSFDVV